MSKLLTVICAAVVGIGVASALTTTADATAVAKKRVTVSQQPAAWTPQVVSSDATVRQLVQCGTTMYAVGSFTSIKQAGVTYPRSNAFSFDAQTGAVTGWNPNVNGEVNSVALSPDCSTAYLGGKFSSVNSVAVKNLAAVSTSTGAVNTAFAHNVGGTVDTIADVNQGADLLVGGNFVGINGTGTKSYYASLDPATGAVNSYLNLTVTGQYPPDSGGTKVYNQQLSPLGDRLLFEGIFTSVGGQPRMQMAELDLSSTGATLDPFANAAMNSTYCSSKIQYYARAATFSPDEQTIYLAATGIHGSSPFCDAVSALTNTPNSTVKWINKTGGDSLYAVAATDTDVFIGGHERWADNPNGHNSCGAGCKDRQGIGDIGVSTGLATAWNPTRDRGHGADDMLLTSDGLWVASDTFFGSVMCGHQYHPGICFFPNA